MDKLQLYIYITIIAIFISGGLYIKHLENNLANEKYNQTKQNDSTSTVKIFKDKKYIDSLKNELIIAQSTIVTPDTFYIDTSKVIILPPIINPDSSVSYMFSDSTVNNRFKLYLNGYITIKNNLAIDNKFIYYHKMFADTIESSIIFNIKTKLLSSKATINGEVYISNTNMYSKVFKGIYNQIIAETIVPKKSNWKWWHNIGINTGIGYNWKGEILPIVSLGYTLTLGDLFR